MKLVVISFVAFGLSILGMAIGLFFGRPAIRGTCGGLAGICDGSKRLLCEDCPHRAVNPPADDEVKR
jgi:hypothetical protein